MRTDQDSLLAELGGRTCIGLDAENTQGSDAALGAILWRGLAAGGSAFGYVLTALHEAGTDRHYRTLYPAALIADEPSILGTVVRQL